MQKHLFKTGQVDFSGISLIGQVIRGDEAASHYGKKYDWITVPNERICSPPIAPNKPPPPIKLVIKRDIFKLFTNIKEITIIIFGNHSFDSLLLLNEIRVNYHYLLQMILK